MAGRELLDVALQVLRAELVEVPSCARLCIDQSDSMPLVWTSPLTYSERALDDLVVGRGETRRLRVVASDGRSRSRVVDDEALERRSARLLGQQPVSWHALSHRPRRSCPRLPSRCPPILLRRALLRSARRPPMYVSSTSTRPESTPLSSDSATRRRCARNQSVR